MTYSQNRQYIWYYLLNDNAPGLARQLEIEIDLAELYLHVAYDRVDKLPEEQRTGAFKTILKREPVPIEERLWVLADFLDATPSGD